MNDRTFVRWAALLLALCLGVPSADATTYNSPTIDGLPPAAGEANPDPSWQPDDLLVEDPIGDSAWGPFNDLHGLWVTWDENGIYFSVEGALWDRASGVGANAVNLYIDVDYGQGTGYGDLATLNQSSLNAVSRNFWRPLVIGSGFGVDWGYTCWAGRFDLGFLDVRDPQAPVNLFQGINDAQSVNRHESPQGVIESRNLAANRGYELFVPWQVFYPDQPAGRVPPGTRIALVVAQVGGGDSLSPESIPDGADDRAIDAPVVFPVDGNGDGIPDRDWPPSGSIAGTVTLADPLDTTTVVEVVARRGEVEVGRARTPAGGGAYTITRLGPGDYSIEIDSSSWCAAPRLVSLAENEDRTGIDFLADRAESGVDLSLVFVDGPEATNPTLSVSTTFTRLSDGRVFAQRTFGPGETMDLGYRVCPGAYRFRARVLADPDGVLKTGYIDIDLELEVEDTIVDLGALELRAVQPTRLVFRQPTVEGTGGDVSSLRLPSSVPAEDFFVRAGVEVAAVDAQGREALLDDALRGEITVSFTSIDPRFPSSGQVDYWTLDDDVTPIASAGDRPDLSTLTSDDARRTRAGFRVSADTRQSARLRVSHPTLATADLEVLVSARLANSIAIGASRLSLVAGDTSAVFAQLLDVIGNPITSEGVVIAFGVEPTAGGNAGVIPASVPTDANGAVGALGDVLFRSTVADTFEVRATAFNGVREVSSDTLAVVIEVRPGPADRLRVDAALTSLTTYQVDVQVTDAFDNAVAVTPRSVTVDAGPSELVAEAPTSVAIGADGSASFEIRIRSGLAGVLQIELTDPSLPVPSTQLDLQLIAGLVAVDDAAPESDPAHNSLPGVDLTSLAAQILGDELVFTLPYASNWGGIHLMLLLEVDETPTGAFSDAFGFPISYGHALLPDYVFTYKYSANDYGDLRRPGGSPGSWQWFNWTSSTWPDAFEDGVNAVAAQRVVKSATDVTFRLPLDVIAPDFRPGVDTVRVQVYLTQEEGDKRPALDSVPQDATVDMEPSTGNWYDPGNLQPTFLGQYAEVVPQPVGDSLRLDAVTFSPETTTQNEAVLVTARPRFEGDAPANPIYQLFADLSALGGGSFVRMNDAGTGGDLTAGDGVYSVRHVVPATQFAGAVDVVVQALELTTSQEVFASGSIEVIGDPEIEPLISAVDAVGDDHGPNQPDRDFLFYEYPTNGVFFDGVFDLQRLDVFDLGDELLFRVTLGDITNPNETSAADWGALFPSDNTCPEGQRTDLNLQNVVILIDSKDGVGVGSTQLPQNRYADVAPQDAWDYAMVFDGWWKGFVKSNGTSSAGSWTVVSADQSFYFCASDQTNTLDGFIAKDQFEEAELAAIRNWDIIVMSSGHDGNSDQNNWGGVRWVNDGIAEWQFGGGRNGEDDRERDPNIVDLLAIPGLDPAGNPKPAGRTQEEQMDFLTPRALQRFNTILNGRKLPSVELEATELVDDVPPTVVVRGASASRAVVPNPVLEDSPVVLRADIRDASGVASARLFWWAPGEDPSARREVPMGRPRADLETEGTEWVADIRWEDVAAATDEGLLEDPENLADRVRFIFVTFDAVDIVGNSTTQLADSDPIVYELPIEQVRRIDYGDLLARAADGAVTLDLSEGSRLRIATETLEAVLPTPDSELELVLRTIDRDVVEQAFRAQKNDTVLGRDNRFLGIARRLEMRAITGSDTTIIDTLPGRARLSLHFPRYLQKGEHPGNYVMFQYNERTDRWILVSGHGESDGSTVTLETTTLGSFAVFTTDEEIEVDRNVTGLVVTPNPFTPNDDGLYDEVQISYVLPELTNWAIVEIYDIRGERVRVLQKFEADEILNRTLGVSWDGKDENGRTVPMGLYVVRVEVQNSNFRVERETRAVAVVR